MTWTYIAKYVHFVNVIHYDDVHTLLKISVMYVNDAIIEIIIINVCY